MKPLYFLVPCFISLLFNRANGTYFSTECVSTFLSPETRKRFDICLTEECLIIKDQNPIVFLDQSMNNPEDQRPFLCSNPQGRHPKLRGVFFDIVEKMGPLRNAHCVWAGENCTFDGILNFVNESAIAGYRHRWVASGLLFSHPYRISLHTLPSSSIHEAKLRVFGPPIQPYTPISEAWDTISKPFTIGSWLFILGCSILGLILRAVMAFLYSRTENGIFNMDEFRNRFSDFDNKFRRDSEEEENSWRRLNLFWWRTASIIVFIVVILWELAIAVTVFDTRFEAPFKSIDPAKFALIRNTGTEHIFRSLVETEAQRNGNRNKTGWKRYNHSDDVFQALLDRNTPVDYTADLEPYILWNLKTKPYLCPKLRLYKEVPTNLAESRKPPTISGGWYFSSKVPIYRQVEINKAISGLKERGIISEIIYNYNGSLPESCKLNNFSIVLVTLALNIVVLIIPFMVFYYIFFWCIPVKGLAKGHDYYHEEALPIYIGPCTKKWKCRTSRGVSLYPMIRKRKSIHPY